MYPGLEEITKIVGHENIKTTQHNINTYLTDWRGHYSGKAIAIVYVHNTGQISAIIHCCQKNNIAIVTQGGNTSLCGASIPHLQSQQSIILKIAMQHVYLPKPYEHFVVTEAGITLYALQKTLEPYGMRVPIMLTTHKKCTVGGIIATNAGGMNVVGYGSCRQQVMGLEVVLPNGRVLNELRSVYKDNSGYDLKQIFIGSEGSLGIITQACLKLHPIPQQQYLLWVCLCSLKDVLDLYHQLWCKSLQYLSACELIPDMAMHLLYEHYPEIFEDLPILYKKNQFHLLIELEDPPQELLSHLKSLITHYTNMYRITSKTEEQEQLWKIRKLIPLAEKKSGEWIKHDISLPLAALEEFISNMKNQIQHHNPHNKLLYFGHIGDGSLHLSILPAGPDTAHELSQLVYDEVEKKHGSFSAEHGIGQHKIKYLRRYREHSYDIMCNIKTLLDPRNLMNPGKIITLGE